MFESKEKQVSVIVPVYNSAIYLDECLNSIMNQTLKNIEIICVDDGSTDESVDILKKYAAVDSRIKILFNTHKDGAGAGAARNMGLRHASGKYMIFLDSDDFFEHDMLEKSVRCAEDNNTEIAIFDALTYDDKLQKESKEISVLNRKILNGKSLFATDEYSKYLFQIVSGGVWNILFSRKFIAEKNICFQEMRYTDDNYFAYMAMAESDRISVLYENFVHYRVNIPDCQTSKRYSCVEIMYEAAVRIKEELEKRGLFDKYKITFWNRFLPFALDYMNHQNEYEKWKECYELLSLSLWDKLDIDGFIALSRNNIFDPYTYSAFKQMKNISREKYLFDESRKTKIYDICLPKEICSRGVKVVIYGAGKYGKAVYGTIFRESICSITNWVDKKYEQIGYPVQPPDSISNTEYDYLLIAVREDSIAERIEEELISKGVEKGKIVRLQREVDGKELIWISLGMNCEVQFQLNNRDYNSESSLFSWAYVGDEEKFIEALHHIDDIMTDKIHFHTISSDMFMDERFKIAFHGRTPKIEMLDENDQIVDYIKYQEAFEELKSRIGYLKEKFKRQLSSTKSKIFIKKINISPTLDEWGGIDRLISIIEQLTSFFSEEVKEYCLVLVIEEKHYRDNLKQFENDNVFIKTVPYFAPINNAKDGADDEAWDKLFKEIIDITKRKI